MAQKNVIPKTEAQVAEETKSKKKNPKVKQADAKKKKKANFEDQLNEKYSTIDKKLKEQEINMNDVLQQYDILNFLFDVK